MNWTFCHCEVIFFVSVNAFSSILSDINIDALPTLAWDLCYISIVILLLSGFQHLYALDKSQVNGKYVVFILFCIFFICLACQHGLHDLSSSTVDWTRPSAVKSQSPFHRIDREFPGFCYILNWKTYFTEQLVYLLIFCSKLPSYFMLSICPACSKIFLFPFLPSVIFLKVILLFSPSISFWCCF